MPATPRHHSISSLGAQIGPVIARHMDLLFRDVLRGEGVVADPRFLRYITGEPHPFGNFAIISDSADPSATEAAIEPLRRCGAPAAALHLGPVAAAVEERLAASGFEPHDVMPAMAVEIEHLSPTSLPPGYRLVRIGGGPEGDAWSEAFAVGYELPRGVAGLFSPTVAGATTGDDASMQFFAIEKDGRQVCTSLLYLNDGVAGIYCVSTIPDERGKGLGAHLTSEPLSVAHRLGYRVGVLQSSPMGHGVYSRLGFRDFGGLPLHVRLPG
ncbi:MAG: GNAT family N-acetyltransferase [Phycisphaerales bacterium]|nr:MAG: GNAT family N-acetyltransferase [Phycisphaerales bacterium]